VVPGTGSKVRRRPAYRPPRRREPALQTCLSAQTEVRWHLAAPASPARCGRAASIPLVDRSDPGQRRQLSTGDGFEGLNHDRVGE
jgi:hypothetical protein